MLVKHAAKKVKRESSKVSEFSIETTKTVRGSCDGCRQKFAIPEIQIKVSLSDQAAWYHVICFARSRSELGWLESGENLPGFKRLSNMNKVLVKRHIP